MNKWHPLPPPCNYWSITFVYIILCNYDLHFILIKWKEKLSTGLSWQWEQCPFWQLCSDPKLHCKQTEGRGWHKWNYWILSNLFVYLRWNIVTRCVCALDTEGPQHVMTLISPKYCSWTGQLSPLCLKIFVLEPQPILEYIWYYKSKQWKHSIFTEWYSLTEYSTWKYIHVLHTCTC